MGRATVGLRRWLMVLFFMVVVIGGFGEAANAMSGPYQVSCTNAPNRGFQVELKSWQTGNTVTLPVPFGGCPS